MVPPTKKGKEFLKVKPRQAIFFNFLVVDLALDQLL